jgi:hypothetical protein
MSSSLSESLNPLEIEIEKVEMHKFSTSSNSPIDNMDLLPQFVEFTIYQSLFEPVIKAEMLVNDNIGLFVNYPLTGEEVISITYSEKGKDASSSKISKTIYFIIRGIRNVAMGDRARSMVFVIDLSSIEFLQNTRKYVSHAYYDTIEKMANQLYDEYISEDTVKLFGLPPKPFNVEQTSLVRAMVIPNLRPLQSIQWLAKHAVSAEADKRFLYLFFENNEGFHFTTIQKLIEDGIALSDSLIPKFKYIANKEIVDNPNFYNPDIQKTLISNIIFNKRFSSTEKISSGYYQNELFEISMLQKAYHSTVTKLETTPSSTTIHPYIVNTPEYVEYVKNEEVGTEYANRVRYIINNYKDFDSIGHGQPEYRRKFGKATQNLIALNQIDITITVPANMDLKAGQIIDVDLPEMHGFNDVDSDPYLSGYFIINEVKQVIGSGGRAATSLRIYKDSYTNEIAPNSKYTLE